MKWLKKFEEVKLKYKKSETGFDTGLSPSIYRSAAHKLSDWNKSNRSDKLKDWADEKQYGFYKMNIGTHTGYSTTSLSLKDVIFTQPQLIGVYYGYHSGENIPINLLKNKDEIEEASERMVNDWVRGDVSCLSLMFEFAFRPTMELIRKAPYLGDLSFRESVNKWNDNFRYVGNFLPTFRINLILTEDSGGIDDYYIYDRHEKHSISEFYNDTKNEYLTINRPFTDALYGVFSDRKSAIDFKNYFLSIINGKDTGGVFFHGSHIDVKSLIMNILSIVGGESEDIEHLMSTLNNIRIHGLYDDEITKGLDNISDRWFGTKFKSTTPYGKKIN